MRGLAVCIAAALLVTAAQAGDEARHGGVEVAGSEPDAVFETFTKPLDNDTQRTVRVLTLANMLGAHCRGAKVDRGALDRYVARSGLRTTSADERDMALAIVTPDFSYFSHDTLVRLCPRIDQLFGPHGVLAPGLVSQGSGVPARSLDPLNPYLPVPMMPHGNGN